MMGKSVVTWCGWRVCLAVDYEELFMVRRSTCYGVYVSCSSSIESERCEYDTKNLMKTQGGAQGYSSAQ